MPKPTVVHPKLKAMIAAKGLSLETLKQGTQIPKSTISQILNGHWNDPTRLAKLSAYIESCPGPQVTLH